MREIKFRAWDKVAKYFIPGGCSIVFTPDEGLERKDIEISQYTWLKDKNEKEIYEGDIVKWTDEYEHEWINKVVYENGYIYPLVQVQTGYNRIDKYDNNEFEIIGNIYENPELLKRD